MRVIAGDVGGTKTLLQCVALDGEGRITLAETRYATGEHGSFSEILDRFHKQVPGPIDAACLAIAGPVEGDRGELTNLEWFLSAKALCDQLQAKQLSLINDFHAVALGVPALAPTDLLSLQRGERRASEPIAILGAGTGLGQAAVIPLRDHWHVIASEGGHADFAPQDERQTGLFLALHEKFGHVSWERVLSGAGLLNIHNFLAGADRPYDDDIPPEIAKAAKSGDAIAREAMEVFVDIYGAEAGNTALRVLARGGVFLAGGIVTKNAEYFQDGRFITSFRRKGRFDDLLQTIPVDIVMNPKVGLMGALEMAVNMAEGVDVEE